MLGRKALNGKSNPESCGDQVGSHDPSAGVTVKQSNRHFVCIENNRRRTVTSKIYSGVFEQKPQPCGGGKDRIIVLNESVYQKPWNIFHLYDITYAVCKTSVGWKKVQL